MGYSQRQSNFNVFFSIRKTFPQSSESNLGVHFFTKQSIPGLQMDTRFYKNKNGEWSQLTGTFIDSLENVKLSNISLIPSKKMDNGTMIPEQIAVDIMSPIEGKVDRIQMVSDSKWGNDFARKIVNEVDFSLPLTIRPFSYVPEGKTKLSEGLSIVQGEIKIQDKYLKFKGSDRPTNINGLELFDPYAKEAEEEKNEKLRSNAWTNYFNRVNVFVISEMVKAVKEANFGEIALANTNTTGEAKEIMPEEDINSKDTPF